MALISEAKRRANRANARRSTGPRSPEGKAAVRLNAVRHGLAGATAVLPDENAAEFEALLERLERLHAPENGVERAEVRRLAEAMWRQRRVAPFEAATLQACIELAATGELAADDVFDLPRHLLRIGRYEGRIARAYDRAQVRLAVLKAERIARAAGAVRALPRTRLPGGNPRLRPHAEEAVRRPSRSMLAREASSPHWREHLASLLKTRDLRARNSQFSGQFGFVSSRFVRPAPDWPTLRPPRAPPVVRRSP